ncbi:MAG: hypothetical protein R2813_07705 [Flavobacteriales bacterium]
MTSIEQVFEHLNRDEQLRSLIASTAPRPPRIEPNVYRVLLRSIVGQQLSTKAAATIWDRFVKLFPEELTPDAVLKLDVEVMRQSGLSYQKASYVQNIARFVMEHELNDAHLQTLTDDEALDFLCQIKGVGRWTAEMILMFSLGREDVFPVDDLGIRQAMIRLYDFQGNKKQQTAQMLAKSEEWRPYRTFVCNLLWDWKDGR